MLAMAIALSESCDQSSELSGGEALFNALTKIAGRFKTEKKLKAKLRGKYGHIDGTTLFKVYGNKEGIVVDVRGGKFLVCCVKLRMSETKPSTEVLDSKDYHGNSATVVFDTDESLLKFLKSDIETTSRMLTYEVWVEGNHAHFTYISYLLNLINPEKRFEQLLEQKEQQKAKTFEAAAKMGMPERKMHRGRLKEPLETKKIDTGVNWLEPKEDQYLSKRKLSQFPRLETMKNEYRNKKPQITSEQGVLLTEFYHANGYEKKKETDEEWFPALRSAEGFRHLMSNKIPLLRDGDLLAGTLTPDPVCGSIGTPFTIGWSIWADLDFIENRGLEEYEISEDTKNDLHNIVFPFWMDRHILQIWKDIAGTNELVPRVNDRLFYMVPWSLISLNPGCPSFSTVMKEGLCGLRSRISEKLEQILKNSTDDKGEEARNQRDTLEAMLITLEGISAYVKNLAAVIHAKANVEVDATRKKELQQIYEILCKVPEKPAETLQEAIQSLWIMFISVALETMDDTITLGRLDQMLQPYFEADMKKRAPGQERVDYSNYALELVGCLFLKLTSHRIAVDTIKTWQNSGSPASCSITVGGVKADSGADNGMIDAVNDMTYIILKATDIMSMDDPDLDARYMPGVNSKEYLNRICEVNYITSGTPAIHNDKQMIKALKRHEQDAFEWVSGGCVEPIIAGMHFAATGDVDTNLTVPLVMAMLDGRHPQWNRPKAGEFVGTREPRLGVATGDVADFKCFDDFFKAFEAQCKHMIKMTVDHGSRKILAAQTRVMPAPLYSALLDGCIENAKGMTHGGAKYNSSGSSFIGLSDVVDSLLSIKKLVFEENIISFEQLKEAVINNFGVTPIRGYENKDQSQIDQWRRIYALVRYRINKYGGFDKDGNKDNGGEATKMVNRVTEMVASAFKEEDNGRDGHYTTGYRSNNNHTVFGNVSSALPSGRLANTPFTSGLTPSPMASKNLQDNLNSVAKLKPELCDNNYTFNVRLSFSKKNSHEENIKRISDYMQVYFDQGGMQIQFNMVDVNTLKDAMDNPDEYPNLIARVAGYTGYYTKMNTDLQLEIIGRTEFEI